VKIIGHVRLLDRICPAKPFFTTVKSLARLIQLLNQVTATLFGHIQFPARTRLAP
jgi:hypothetical protein